MGKAHGGAPGGMTPAQQGIFLKVLGETGNASAAARAAGVKRGTPYNLKRRDQWFARDWAEAAASAAARIGARQPDALLTIRKSAGGRTQLAALRPDQWSKRDDKAFFAHLEASGNVRASARAIGRNPNTAWRRRRESPDFARRFEAALGDAEIRLEYALVDYANNLVDRAADALDPPPDDAPDDAPDDVGAGPQSDTITPVEASFALQVLKWLDGRKAGKTRGARHHAFREPPIEEVRASIMRKLDAIEAHEKKQAAKRERNGDSYA